MSFDDSLIFSFGDVIWGQQTWWLSINLQSSKGTVIGQISHNTTWSVFLDCSKKVIPGHLNFSLSSKFILQRFIRIFFFLWRGAIWELAKSCQFTLPKKGQFLEQIFGWDFFHKPQTKEAWVWSHTSCVNMPKLNVWVLTQDVWDWHKMCELTQAPSKRESFFWLRANLPVFFVSDFFWLDATSKLGKSSLTNMGRLICPSTLLSHP